ncbi:MAG TPA: lasso RiPP family leader peptide-containing protein [Acidimicrobiales bacterium]|nr:lasso RiPP family leader peptide-containing protein [Acidimicrobiales bacterium]
MDDAQGTDLRADDGYEAPDLTEYGSIEEWTKGRYAEAVNVSIFI